VFLVTTAIGLLPANLVFTYFASALVDSVAGDRAMVFLRLGLAVAALLALSFLPTAIIGRQRRRRYRSHRETRRRRPRG
jgi:sulfite exporter TauE/SafE